VPGALQRRHLRQHLRRDLVLTRPPALLAARVEFDPEHAASGTLAAMRRAVLLMLLVSCAPRTAAPARPAPPPGRTLAWNVRMSDCEGRWVALPKDGDTDLFAYGVVYVDPEAGFSFRTVGRFSVTADGRYQKHPDPELERAVMINRLEEKQDPEVALLPQGALADLGETDPPAWLSSYADHADPLAHRVKWGRHYNHIGASAKALTFLEPAYARSPRAEGLAFELGFAYNALGRFDDALRVLEPAVKRTPDDLYLIKELGSSYGSLKRYQDAAGLYEAILASYTGSDMVLKSEVAFNLAASYYFLGDASRSEAWLAKAREWAPDGSQLDLMLNH
jgi:Flp pilus assembly protein TadD